MFNLPVWGWIVLAIVNIPTYLFVGAWVFGNWDGFKESVRLAIQPDWWSFMKGELADDWAEGFRMALFIIVSGIIVVLQAWLLGRLFA